jgi:hypothetical protein
MATPKKNTDLKPLLQKITIASKIIIRIAITVKIVLDLFITLQH